MHNNTRTTTRRNTRATGRDWRTAVWLARHPLWWALPLGLAVLTHAVGLVVTGAALAGLLLVGLGWSRAHPTSYDRLLAPWLRSARRRWSAYAGPRWRNVLTACDLTRENRRTGELVVPRVLRVRSATPSIDTVYVRLVRGQDLRTWTERAEALAHALGAHRVAIATRRPGGSSPGRVGLIGVAA